MIDDILSDGRDGRIDPDAFVYWVCNDLVSSSASVSVGLP
jgi:hypothetical protein